NRKVLCSAPWRLLGYTPERVRLELPEPGAARVEFAEGPLRSVAGRLREVEAEYRDGEVRSLHLGGAGPFAVDPPHYAGAVAPRPSAGAVAPRGAGAAAGCAR